jgi:hypothetical protein
MQAKRPTTIEGMRGILQKFATAEGVQRGLAYRPGPTDVFISPFAKCGTTWMQQIVHGLRTRGSMDFPEITAVVPWLELAHDMGMDVNAPQAASPRAFKSHLDWEAIPKGGRYIVVFRDPVDAMVSMYRFFDGWFLEAGSVPLETFAEYYLSREGGSSYWGHAASWFRQRARPDVLLFCYEDMKRDLPAVVGRVAGFIGAGTDAETRALAAEQAGFAFMKRHADQFDDHLIRQTRDAACGLPPGGSSTKVDQGEAGRGTLQVTQAIRDRFAARWRETMEAEFGLASYGDLVRALEAPRQ